MSAEVSKLTPDVLRDGALFYPTENLGIVPCVRISEEGGQLCVLPDEQRGISYGHMPHVYHTHTGSGFDRGPGTRHGFANSTFGFEADLRVVRRHTTLPNVMLIEQLRKPYERPGRDRTAYYKPNNAHDAENTAHHLKEDQFWMMEETFLGLVQSGKLEEDRRIVRDPKQMSLDRAYEIMNGVRDAHLKVFRSRDRVSSDKAQKPMWGILFEAHERILMAVRGERVQDEQVGE